MRNDSVNKQVVASNVVIVRRQFCNHTNNLKNLGKTFQRIGKQWRSVFEYLSEVLQSCGKSRGFKTAGEASRGEKWRWGLFSWNKKQDREETGVKWKDAPSSFNDGRGVVQFLVYLWNLIVVDVLTFVCLRSVEIVRKRPQGMPVIPFIKFPANVEYLFFILVSEVKTNRQACHKMLFSMSSMTRMTLTQRTPFNFTGCLVLPSHGVNFCPHLPSILIY